MGWNPGYLLKYFLLYQLQNETFGEASAFLIRIPVRILEDFLPFTFLTRIPTGEVETYTVDTIYVSTFLVQKQTARHQNSSSIPTEILV